MLLQALSIGREVDVWSPRTGMIHSVFERAVNLLVEGELWTVLGAARPDASFGIRLAHGEGGFEVKVGNPVAVRAGFVSLGRLVIDCRTANYWAPTRWAKPAPNLASRIDVMEQAARSRAWSGSASMADDVTAALHGSDLELAAAARRIVGCGPGLTPSGDDVLIGIFALLTAGAVGAAGVEAASQLACALAPVLATTSDISRHLLQQAARGLPGRALHDLGKALVEGAPREVFAGALALVLDTGVTSGADACMGLAAACRCSFLSTERLAA